jgi:DNA sulfur modification protein DndB
MQFEQKAIALLGSSSSQTYKAELANYSDFMNEVTAAIPVLTEIAALPPGTPRNVIKDRRAEGWICLSATGMVIIGRIGHELFKKQRGNWKDTVRRLGDVDWSRNGELWQNNIVRDGKITTQRAPVRSAVDNVRIAVGLAEVDQLSLV